MYVGSVKSCVEWDKYIMQEYGVTESGGQLKLLDMTNDPVALKTAKMLIEKYSYYMSEIRRIAEKEQDDDIGVGVARYGLEATLPRGSKTGDKVLDEVTRRLQNSREAIRYRGYVEKLQKAKVRCDPIMSDKCRTVLDMLMDGKDMKKIADAIQVSRQWAYQYKDTVIAHIAGALMEVNGK
jgi:hypothetical protein